MLLNRCFPFPLPLLSRRLLAWSCLWLALALAPLEAWGAGAVSTLPPEERPLAEVAPYRRLLWVTRWDYTKPADLERIFRLAAQARFSDVLFQVRGEGTVFFKSPLEPWAWELSGKGVPGTGTDPGWDPLEKAVAEAHRYGMRIHAYVNVMPGWAQKSVPPTASRQLFAVHRSWFMTTPEGKRMDPRTIPEPPVYAFVDPALPEVRSHVAALVADMVRRYKVDGVHLDYIRYPFENGGYGSCNPESLRAFREEFGGTPASRPKQWQQFKTEQITEMVRAISVAARRERPGLTISAAIIADEHKRRDLACQDAEDWIRQGLVDAVAPMAYTGKMDDFREFCAEFEKGTFAERTWLGVWAQLDRNARLIEQTRYAVSRGFPGVAIFSYSDLFPDGAPTRRVVSLYRLFAGVEP